MRITCEQCCYWELPQEEERLGECRRMPPVHEFWPVTYPHDWCGQAMPKDSGSSQPVHEVAQALVEAWEGGSEADVLMERLREALERMKP